MLCVSGLVLFYGVGKLLLGEYVVGVDSGVEFVGLV